MFVCAHVLVCIYQVGQALEKSSPLNRLSSRMGEIRVGLEEVQTLLQRRSSSVSEAEHVLKVCDCVYVCVCLRVCMYMCVLPLKQST